MYQQIDFVRETDDDDPESEGSEHDTAFDEERLALRGSPGRVDGDNPDAEDEQLVALDELGPDALDHEGWVDGDDPDEEIITPFTRANRVGNSLEVPFRWVCSIEADPARGGPRPSATFGRGSGVLIGPRHVLTSAHVLLDEAATRPRLPEQIRVTIAQNGRGQRGITFPTLTTRRCVVHSLWRNENLARLKRLQTKFRRDFFQRFPNFDKVLFQRIAVQRWHFDYGLVILEKDVDGLTHDAFGRASKRNNRLGYWGGVAGARLRRLSPSRLSNQTARTAGYPLAPQSHRRLSREMYSTDGQILPVHLWDRGLRHTMSTDDGSSGGPVWIEHGGLMFLVGVHQGGGIPGDNVNRAVRVTDEFLKVISHWKSRS